jgi:hypothetical protein
VTPAEDGAGTVICLAGRRIDPPDADPQRFPPSRAPAVAERIRQLLEQRRAALLVCSAACGADLLALDAAARLGMQLHIVLPFDRERFRATSVTDRPGGWGEIYDRVIDHAQHAGTLTIIDTAADDDAEAYAAANTTILDIATREARGGAREASARDACAVIVWEGSPRGDDDLTAHFAATARARGLEVVEIRTL